MECAEPASGCNVISSWLECSAREAHLRLHAFERMLDDGVTHATDLFHRQGLALDVWTLDAGTPRWRERLAPVVAAGVDMVTTNTPRELAAAGRTL
jgi:glycerophosphoryl diester phosphodiesterase